MRGNFDFEVVAPPVQRVSHANRPTNVQKAPAADTLLRGEQDIAEAIAQLAMCPPGREALLQDPSVVEALQQLAAEGWTEEARMYAESALRAMSDQPDAAGHGAQDDEQARHIMMSYQWDCQKVHKQSAVACD